MNLNRLTSSTAYGAATRAPGKVISTYGGLSSYADDLGFFFQYWPCDQSGACASQCRATGANLPCLMRPAITSYQCGITAGITITGATPADGTNTVDWKVDTTYPVFNGSTVIRFVNSLTGTNN